MEASILVKIIGAAVIISGSVVSPAAAAGDTPSTLVSCFVFVHEECHGDGNVDCSEDLYYQGVDWCVQSFPGESAAGSATELKAEMSRRLKFLR